MVRNEAYLCGLLLGFFGCSDTIPVKKMDSYHPEGKNLREQMLIEEGRLLLYSRQGESVIFELFEPNGLCSEKAQITEYGSGYRSVSDSRRSGNMFDPVPGVSFRVLYMEKIKMVPGYEDKITVAIDSCPIWFFGEPKKRTATIQLE